MVAIVERFRAEGYRAHSIKVGSTVADDLARIHAVQAASRPGEVYQIDVNRGWTLDTALQVLSELRGTNLYIEQPCATYRECLAVKRHSDLPVMLDEIVSTPEDLQRVLRDDAADALNLKTGRVGGLTKMRRLRDMGGDAGIAMTLQETGGAEVAFAAVVQLAQSDAAPGLAQPLGPARAQRRQPGRGRAGGPQRRRRGGRASRPRRRGARSRARPTGGALRLTGRAKARPE